VADRQPRSPKYPFISLSKSIAQAGKLADFKKGGWVSEDQAAEAWSVGKDSSAVPQTVAALSQFGLLEMEGRGKERRVAPSGLARRILGSPKTELEALQEAALKPEVFRELWEALQSKPGMDRSALVDLLTNNRSWPFNPRAADEVLRLFDETMAFAELEVAGQGSRGDDAAKQELNLHGPASGVEEVLAGGRIRIHFSDSPSAGDYELLRGYCDLMIGRSEGSR